MTRAELDLMDRLRSSDIKLMTVPDNYGENDLLRLNAKEIYFSLLDKQPHESALAQSRLFLHRELSGVPPMEADLPADSSGLSFWMRSNTTAVGRQYQDYLAVRRSGQGRRYFTSKSHALYFLRGVAPTKLVDGAWLYGLVSHWRDARYAELIRIYLEELGEGDPEKNHVLLYQKLLDRHECAHWEDLDEPHFVQGAIQLAFAQHASDYLPEIIGYNLGYEQLPLHLLICAYELNELGIDPYYFTLHVTIDNAASGHAARAVRSVTDAMPRLGNKEAFYRRVCNGYALNSLGMGANHVIAGFDLERELVDVLAAKASVGSQLHSDYCRIAGKTVNEWLAAPDRIRGFVEALEKTGWIRRHEHPENSRFWNLIAGEKGPMFGVFSAYERQVIYDWIAGEGRQYPTGPSATYRGVALASDAGFQESLRRPRSSLDGSSHGVEPKSRLQGSKGAFLNDEFNAESRLLSDRLAAATGKAEAMDLLAPLLSPVHHHTAAGLMATRTFAQWLRA